jgi:hypothetical protein
MPSGRDSFRRNRVAPLDNPFYHPAPIASRRHAARTDTARNGCGLCLEPVQYISFLPERNGPWDGTPAAKSAEPGLRYCYLLRTAVMAGANPGPLVLGGLPRYARMPSLLT